MRKLFWIVLPVVLIAGALAGGVFIYKAGIKQETVQKSQLPSLTPPENLELTPIPELKRENLKLQVLNGRGVAGTAGEAKDYLESLGYQNIEVGNADSYDFEKTEISLKKDNENYFDLLKADLSEKYVTSEEVEILETESQFDAVVIIGEK